MQTVVRALMQWGVVLLLLACSVGATAADAAPTAPSEIAEVPAAGITVSYPARWINVPLHAHGFAAAYRAARAQDPTVTREEVRLLLDMSFGADLIAIDRYSGDNVRVTVRNDPFDTSSADELKPKLSAEAEEFGLELLSVETTTVGPQPAYRFVTTLARGRVLSTNLFLAHPETDTTISVVVVTDRNARGRRTADRILHSVAFAAPDIDQHARESGD